MKLTFQNLYINSAHTSDHPDMMANLLKLCPTASMATRMPLLRKWLKRLR